MTDNKTQDNISTRINEAIKSLLISYAPHVTIDRDRAIIDTLHAADLLIARLQAELEVSRATELTLSNALVRRRAEVERLAESVTAAYRVQPFGMATNRAEAEEIGERYTRAKADKFNLYAE